MSFVKHFSKKIRKTRAASVEDFYPFTKKHREPRKVRKVRHYNPLKPKNAKSWRIGAFDIETKAWQDEKGEWHDARDLSDPDKSFSFGSCMWQNKEGEVFTEVFYSRKEMADFMIQKKFKGYHWWGFASGRFDLIGLYHAEVLDSEKFRMLYRNGSIIQLTYLGGKKVKDGKISYDSKVYFNDLRLITGGTLKDLGKVLGLKKLENEKRSDTVGFGEITEEDIKYNIRDTEIVFRFVQQMNDLLFDKFGVRMKYTIASISSNVFKTAYLSDTYPKGLRINEVDSLFRKSYYGGRVELFDRRMEEFNVVGFDVNSLYPYVMWKYDYPDPESLKYYRKLPHGWQNMLGVVSCTVYAPEELKDKYPVLPYKNEKGKLIFPVGIFHGSWNVPELVYAMKFGYKILKVDYAVLTKKRVKPFVRFIDDLYTMRKSYEAQGNLLYKQIIKIIMNSSYGKFAQRVKHQEFGRVDDKSKLRQKGRWYVITQDPASDYGIWVEVDDKGQIIEEDSDGDIISWASTITSYARVELHKRIMMAYEKGHKVVYSDTDSLFIEEKDETAKNALEIGHELGMVKIEHWGLAKFFAPKIYWVKEKNGKMTEKHKGVGYTFNFAPDYVTLHKGERVPRKDTEEERKSRKSFGWDHFSGSFVKLCNVSDLVRYHRPLGATYVVNRKLTGADEKRDWQGTRGFAKVVNEYVNLKLDPYKRKIFFVDIVKRLGGVTDYGVPHWAFSRKGVSLTYLTDFINTLGLWELVCEDDVRDMLKGEMPDEVRKRKLDEFNKAFYQIQNG